MEHARVQHELAVVYRGAVVKSRRKIKKHKRAIKRRWSFNAVTSLLTVLLGILTAGYSSFLFVTNDSISSEPIRIEPAAPPSLLKVTPASFASSLSNKQRREMATRIHFIASKMTPYQPSLHEAHFIARKIVEESYKTEFDPIFIAAVVFAESAFSNQAISRVGARGLMQLMPDTAKFISHRSEASWKGISALHTTEYNVKLGTKYLLYLAQIYKGDKTKSLLAYNWGPGNLNRFLKGSGRMIPGESKAYVKKINHYYEKWSREFSANHVKYEFGALYHSIY